MANYIIISANSDIAKETANILTNQGHKIFITTRKEDDLHLLKNKFGCEGEILDASNFEETENLFKKAIDNLGQIDGVANFAGSVILKPAHLTSQNDYFETINSNTTTAFSVVRACGKFLKKGGSVVLFSSAASMQGIANHEAIATAKGAIISLAKSASATYASQNLRFNVVAPGLTATKLTQKITNNEASLNYSKSMHALGRIGEAKEVANVAVFLLNPENSFITGQIIAVDGGLSSLQPKIKI